MIFAFDIAIRPEVTPVLDDGTNAVSYVVKDLAVAGRTRGFSRLAQ